MTNPSILALVDTRSEQNRQTVPCGSRIRLTLEGHFLLLAVCAWCLASRAEVVVEPPGAIVAGKSIAEWSAAWWQWGVALAPPGSPFTDTTGEFASVNQSGPVFFLAGSSGGLNYRRFLVPTNVYVMVPLVVGEQSQLELGFDKTGAEVKLAAQLQADLIDGPHATLDGVAIPQAQLFTYRTVSPEFSFTAVSGNSLNVPPGESGIAVADGYFLMLSPMSPGVHTLEYGGTASALQVSLREIDTVLVGEPKITTQPTNQTVTAGQLVRFVVKADGARPLECRWYYSRQLVLSNGVPIGTFLASTNSLLSLASTLSFPATESSAGHYWAVISNVTSQVVSSIATLTVLAKPPVITIQPKDQAVFFGSEAIFSVSATTVNPPLSFQWQFNGTDVPQATNSTLVVSNVQSADFGEYRVLVRDRASSITSTPAQLTLLALPPVIVTQPSGLGVVIGSNAMFSVVCESGPTPAYQWRFNEQPIEAATGSTLTISNVQPAQMGAYSVIVTNMFGSTTSQVAHLRVLAWQRTYSAPGLTNLYVGSMAVDGSDNVIILGRQSSSTAPDLYILKCAAADGQVVWEEYHTNAPYGSGNLALDRDGNVLVSGGYWPNCFTAKYAATDGALLWERGHEGGGLSALAVDHENDVLVTGSSKDAAGFLALTVTKYSPEGSNIWVCSGPSFDGVGQTFRTPSAHALALDSRGNVIVIGEVANYPSPLRRSTLVYRKVCGGRWQTLVAEIL